VRGLQLSVMAVHVRRRAGSRLAGASADGVGRWSGRIQSSLYVTSSDGLGVDEGFSQRKEWMRPDHRPTPSADAPAQPTAGPPPYVNSPSLTAGGPTPPPPPRDRWWRRIPPTACPA